MSTQAIRSHGRRRLRVILRVRPEELLCLEQTKHKSSYGQVVSLSGLRRVNLSLIQATKSGALPVWDNAPLFSLRARALAPRVVPFLHVALFRARMLRLQERRTHAHPHQAIR